jgi:hypothetical protein
MADEPHTEIEFTVKDAIPMLSFLYLDGVQDNFEDMVDYQYFLYWLLDQNCFGIEEHDPSTHITRILGDNDRLKAYRVLFWLRKWQVDESTLQLINDELYSFDTGLWTNLEKHLEKAGYKHIYPIMSAKMDAILQNLFKVLVEEGAPLEDEEKDDYYEVFGK